MSNSNGASIFISSTVLDLGDVRVRLASVINGLGLRPIQSEAPGFGADRGLEPHVAALRELERADGVLAIIGWRYGHRFVTGWPIDVDYGAGRSPTATEILHSLHMRKTTIVYVRKEVWDDYYTIYPKRSRLPEEREREEKYQDFKGTMELLASLKAGRFPAGKPWLQKFTSVEDIEEDLRSYIGCEVRRSWAKANGAADSRAATLALKAVQAFQPIELETRLLAVFRTGLGRRYCQAVRDLAAQGPEIEGQEMAKERLRMLKENILLQVVVPEVREPVGRSDGGALSDAIDQAWRAVVIRECLPDAASGDAGTRDASNPT